MDKNFNQGPHTEVDGKLEDIQNLKEIQKVLDREQQAMKEKLEDFFLQFEGNQDKSVKEQSQDLLDFLDQNDLQENFGPQVSKLKDMQEKVDQHEQQINNLEERVDHLEQNHPGRWTGLHILFNCTFTFFLMQNYCQIQIRCFLTTPRSTRIIFMSLPVNIIGPTLNLQRSQNLTVTNPSSIHSKYQYQEIIHK